MLVMSVYQFLQKTDQEKKDYLSVYVNKSLRREQDGGNIVCIFLLAIHFLSTQRFIASIAEFLEYQSIHLEA